MEKKIYPKRELTRLRSEKGSRRAAGKVSYCAMLAALAMIFSYVEALIPVNFGIPGIKLGIANLVTVVGLYFLNPGEVLLIAVSRIVLVSFLFGNGMSLIYSLAGGLVSFAAMLLLKKAGRFSISGVSMAGGIFHNAGQLLVAAFVVKNIKLFCYFPVLLISGTLTGALIGILAGRILPVVGAEGRKIC